MPSKKHILNKIREIDNELTKLKAMFFDHYIIDSQETKSNSMNYQINSSDSSPDIKDLINKDYSQKGRNMNNG